MFLSVKFAIELSHFISSLIVAQGAIPWRVSVDYRKSFLKNGEHYHNKSVTAYISERHTRDICDALRGLGLKVKHRYGENNEC